MKRASGILLLGSIVSKVLRLAGDLVIGRVLGAAGFGVIAAASSLAGILGELALLGTHRAALRFASLADGREERTLVRRALLVPVVAGIALALPIVVWRVPLTRILFGDTVSAWVLPAFALAVPAIGVFSVLQFVARGQKRFVADTLVGDVCRMGLTAILSVALLAAGFGLWGAAWGFVLGSIATALAGLAIAARARHTARAAPAAGAGAGAARIGGATASNGATLEVPGMAGLLRVALPLSVGSTSLLLMNELDKVVLAAFRPESEVGVYNAAFRIARQILIVMPALNAAISPFVAPLLAEGRTDELRRLYRGTVRWSLAAGWSATLLFCGFAGDFLGLFGGEFAAGTHILVVVCLGHLVQAAAGTVAVVIQYSGHERKELVNGLLVMGASVALNFALVPRFGALGSAYASLASLALVNGLRMAQAWRILDVMPFDRTTAHVLGVGAGGFVLGWGLRAAASAALGGIEPAAGAAIATAGMALAWGVYFVGVGVSAEEAVLLRLPKRWAKRGASGAAHVAATAPDARTMGSAGSAIATGGPSAPDASDAVVGVARRFKMKKSPRANSTS